ncbi:MAG: WYL domain-containing protein [Nocardioides sp.]
MAAPRYVQRVARLPEVLAHLAAQPDGLPLAELAARFGIDPDELREDLLAYYSADVSDAMFGLARPETLEFLGPEGDLADPNIAFAVQVVDPGPMTDVGVEHVSAAELALLYTAATALHDVDPDDEDLASAIDVLATSLVDGAEIIPRQGSGTVPIAVLREAQAARRAVRIDYSRAWSEGVGSRVIHPYRLVQTQRGWEVDAGPVAADGGLRTFLVANIRSVQVLEETFQTPAEMTALLARQRATTRVRMQIPHQASWAPYLYAERVHRVSDDADTFTADLDLLPPVGRRVGLITLAAPDGTRVLAPAELAAAVADLAAELLDHHRGSDLGHG